MKRKDLLQDLSRREFLKFLGMGFATSLLPRQTNAAIYNRDALLGRVATYAIKVYNAPSYNADEISQIKRDVVLPIKKITLGDDQKARNRIWYELTGLGFVHSRYLQPVKKLVQIETHTIPPGGRLGEITVPFIDAFSEVRGLRKVYRFYYAATFWVLERIRDTWGVNWYKVLDDRNHRSYFIRAYAMRLVPYSELSPISPEIDPDDKYLQVNLQGQTVTAFEQERPVFNARISSGTLNLEGTFFTPTGHFRTTRKRPCRHMASPASGDFTGFDLLGVPWVSYFTGDGIAFHGAYWHNNFGVPMSHGCINMAPQAAKWIYLWTLPYVPTDQYHHADDNATLVKII